MNDYTSKNSYLILPNKTIEIALTQNKTAIIDVADAWILQYRWCAVKARKTLWYSHTNIDKRSVYMHRLIMGCIGESNYVDHINRDGLDNRRENLRITSQRENIINTGMFSSNSSGYKGVTKYKNGYRAQCKHKQITVSSRTYKDKEQAAKTRDAFVRIIVGGAAYFNFPDSHEKWAILEAERMIEKFNRRWKGVKDE